MDFLKICFFIVLGLSFTACRENAVPYVLEKCKPFDGQLPCDTCRKIKFYFKDKWSDFSNSLIKIGHYEFEKSDDTLTLFLPKQEMDTFGIKNRESKELASKMLLHFETGKTYFWDVNPCSDVAYIRPESDKNDTTKLRNDFSSASFTLINYEGEGKIVASFRSWDNQVVLKNNRKSKYLIDDFGGLCGTNPVHICIRMPSNQIKKEDENSTNRDEKLVEFWFVDMFNEKLDITYDFKTKKTVFKIVN